MRPNSVGPYLLLTPDENTKLEFWDTLNARFEAYIHSYWRRPASPRPTPGRHDARRRWRQTNTSLTLAAGGSQSYGFKFQWADDYDGVRQALVDEGKLDIHIVPGMTLPTNLFAKFALRTTQTIQRPLTRSFRRRPDSIARRPNGSDISCIKSNSRASAKTNSRSSTATTGPRSWNFSSPNRSRP